MIQREGEEEREEGGEREIRDERTKMSILIVHGSAILLSWREKEKKRNDSEAVKRITGQRKHARLNMTPMRIEATRLTQPIGQTEVQILKISVTLV